MKAPELSQEIIFASSTKIGGNNQHFRQLFFKKHLHFGTSNEISTLGKLNLILINSIYLFFYSLKMQKRLIQTKVHKKIFNSVF